MDFLPYRLFRFKCVSSWSLLVTGQNVPHCRFKRELKRIWRLGRSPGDMVVRPDKHRAVRVDTAQPGPRCVSFLMNGLVTDRDVAYWHPERG
jgi:hypothetical protein